MKEPRGKGWAAYALTLNPEEYLSQEQIYQMISRHITVGKETARKWLVRIRPHLEKKKIGTTIRYRAMPEQMGTLLDLASAQRAFAGGTPYAPCPSTVPPTVPAAEAHTDGPAIQETQALAYATPAAIYEGTPSQLTNSLQEHEGKDQLHPMQLYDPDDHPRLRLSRKCRRYPLIPGCYEKVKGLFFSYTITEQDSMGTWTQYRTRGGMTRQHQEGSTRYVFYLFLKPNFLEIHLPPWEGYDPFRMDDEMEYILDEVMSTLLGKYGQPFTGPATTDYANQELEHYDLVKGRWLLDAGATADSKVAWHINPRVLKYADMSGARYREDKVSPDVGSSTAHSKALQMQPQIFHEEYTARAYEGVRDIQDRVTAMVNGGVATRSDLRGLTSAMNRMVDFLEGKGELPPPAEESDDYQDYFR